MKIRLHLLLIFLTFAGCDTSKGGSVKTKEEAVEIAEKELIKNYGEQILRQRPFSASDKGDSWDATGSFNCPPNRICKGGVATIKIRKEDGKILKIRHGR